MGRQSIKTWRKHLKEKIFLTFLLFSVPVKCISSDFALSRADTIIPGMPSSSLRVLKFNPVQLAFAEIPVSWEIFRNKNESIQYQIGILIPYFREFPVVAGSLLPAPSTGVLSIRTMPYFSRGISSKIELRQYGKKNYFAFQCMYKYSSYDNVPFTIWGGGGIYETHEQIESKSSHILGMGFMIGRQKYWENFVVDKYFGFGFRFRIVNGVISAQEYPSPLGIVNINDDFYYSSIYPFINLGIRFGKTLQKKPKKD